MAREIRWTEAAWNDLEAAADYIAKDSPAFASALVRKARDAARSLANFAERRRIVPEFGDRTVRELLVERFRLIYRVGKDDIEIVAFVHGARDLRQLPLRGEASSQEG